VRQDDLLLIDGCDLLVEIMQPRVIAGAEQDPASV
jgi:hypothetical protein